jgi:hypothetical protein
VPLIDAIETNLAASQRRRRPMLVVARRPLAALEARDIDGYVWPAGPQRRCRQKLPRFSCIGYHPPAEPDAAPPAADVA